VAEDTLTFAGGFDAWVLENNPGTNKSGGDLVRLQASERKGIVQMPLSGIRGKTIPQALLYPHVGAGWEAQTVTVHLAATGVDSDTVTWDDFPANVAGLSAAATTGTLATGASFAIDITDLVQAIADGTVKNHGFVLTTNAAAVNTANLRSFTSGKPAFKLLVTVSDAPEKPTNLRPNDGEVGSGAPTVAWDGGTIPWSQIQVQADSGTKASTDSRWNLATATSPSFSALTSGADTQWRVRAGDGTQWGPWSDAATFGYTPKHANVFDSPTGGTIGDPTPSVLAHITGGTLRQYRLLVARGADRTDLVYDSGHQPPDGTTIARDIPWRDPHSRRRVITGDDSSWQIGLRTWSTVDRAEAVGDPTYVETWVSVTFDDDGAIETPSDYTVTPVSPGSPQLVHRWTRSEAAEASIIRNLVTGKIVHRLDPDDIDVDAGTYTFTDAGETPPYRAAEYAVHALDAGARSAPSNTVTITPKPTFFWILPDRVLRALGVPPIRLKGTGISGFTERDSRETFDLLNVDTDVDLVYGYQGVSATGFQASLGAYDTDDVLAVVEHLETIRRTPTARPRLVWASQSIRAQIKNMSPLPRDDFRGENLKHQVVFDFVQDGD
jgi:hypothetical protein